MVVLPVAAKVVQPTKDIDGALLHLQLLSPYSTLPLGKLLNLPGAKTIGFRNHPHATQCIM